MRDRLRTWVLKKLFDFGKFKWIVDSDREVGFMLFGHAVIFHKWPDTPTVICMRKDFDSNYWIRNADKRELISRYNEDAYVDDGENKLNELSETKLTF